MRGSSSVAVAASMLARPRVTQDVEAIVVLDENQWEHFLGITARFGFEPRLRNRLAFARRARVCFLRHAPSMIDRGLATRDLAFEREAVCRRAGSAGGLSLPLPSPEDLVMMKGIAHRHARFGGCRVRIGCHPKFDSCRRRRWVREFSASLDMPEISSDPEEMI